MRLKKTTATKGRGEAQEHPTFLDTPVNTSHYGSPHHNGFSGIYQTMARQADHTIDRQASTWPAG